jgi:hypothetical protein
VKKVLEQMDDNFYQDDFEQFLQKQADDHRMFPSDGVWRSIHKQLHGDSRWPALTVAAFSLLIATIAICVYFTPNTDIFAIPSSTSTEHVSTPNNKSNFSSTNILAPGAHSKKIWVENSNWKPTLIVTEEQQTTTGTAITAPIQLDAAPGTVTSTRENLIARQTIEPVNDVLQLAAKPSGQTIQKAKVETEALVNTATPALIGKKESKNVTPIADADDRNVADKFLKENKNEIALHTGKKSLASKVNTWSYNVYVTPSISYRKLKEDRSYLKENNGGPVALNYVADVHQIVRHKPGNGLEAGFSLMYGVSPKLRLKGGVQFNFRQYSIEAYHSAKELASIALIRQKRVDTVNTFASYRTTNGNSAAEITNRYYQLSLPIGVDWQVLGNRAIQINVAGTIQPTYQLNRDAYILSTNLKNYTESPEMLKRLNLNTSIEVYMSFKMGDYMWQLGPQLRYQNLPTLIPEYPIKEHLMDYGIKLGVTKPLH